MQKLSHQLEKVTKPIFSKQGFNHTKIIDDWHLIVGAELASYTLPMKISFPKFQHNNSTITSKSKAKSGILYVYVKNNSIAIELQYMKQIIIEKIAIYFGFLAVEQIHTIVNFDIFPKNDIEYEHIASNSNENQIDLLALSQAISYITDETLRSSLLNLGELILESTNLNKNINN